MPKIKTKEEFVSKSIEVHRDKFDYSKVEFKNLTTPIYVICPSHGEFKTQPRDHLLGSSCKKCRYDSLIYSNEEYINKLKEIYGEELNNYDLSKIDYKGVKEKIIVICKTHGEFLIWPSSLLTGTRCKQCSVDSQTMKWEYFIEKANLLFDNRYNYIKPDKFKAHDKVEIICKKHGNFFKPATEHINGKQGCPKCSKIIAINKQSLTTEEFITKAKLKHGDKYDYSLVNYINQKIKVKIICPDHGKWEQTPSNHLYGFGCSRCFGTNCDQDFFHQKIKERVSKENLEKYDYSKFIYKGAKEKGIVICKIHGEWEMNADNALRGKGCPVCREKNMRMAGQEAIIVTWDEFVERSTKIHNNKFKYNKVPLNFTLADSLVEVECPTHGIFRKNAGQHMRGTGCKKCQVDALRISQEDFLIAAKETHKDRYNYSKTVYTTYHDKIIIICKKHGEFSQSAGSHISGNGCKLCSYTVSTKETAWLDSLGIPNENRNKYIHLNGRRYNVDGIDYEKKIVYEFNGDFWHGNPKIFKPEDINSANKLTFGELYKKTLDKEDWIKQNGYEVVAMWESEFKI